MKTFDEALTDYAIVHEKYHEDPACWLHKYDSIGLEAINSLGTVQLLHRISVKACLNDGIKEGTKSDFVFNALFWAFISGLTIGVEMEKTEVE